MIPIQSASRPYFATEEPKRRSATVFRPKSNFFSNRFHEVQPRIWVSTGILKTSYFAKISEKGRNHQPFWVVRCAIGVVISCGGILVPGATTNPHYRSGIKKSGFFFVRAVRIFKMIARCSKCDFWNLGEIWDRNR